MTTVAVVGTGILGACVAFNLAQRGVHVHCVERAQPGGGTTKVSFARLSAYQQPTRTRFELAHAGMAEYAHLAEQFSSSPSWWHPCGGLAWCNTEGENAASDRELFMRDVDRLNAWGYRVVWYEAAHVNCMWEPGIVFPHQSTLVAQFPEEGWIDAPQLVHSLIKAATDLGKLTFWQDTIEVIETHTGRVTAIWLACGERIEVDALVNAAGPDAATLTATLGIPLLTGTTTRSSLVMDLVVDDNPLSHVLRAPDIHIRSAGSGRVRVRSDQVDSGLPTATQPYTDPALVADLLQRAYRTIPTLASSSVEQVQIGTAVFPADGHPSAGALSALPGYYEALSNSGITLGPLLGRLLAEQIVTGEVHPLLQHCSPDRLREH